MPRRLLPAIFLLCACTIGARTVSLDAALAPASPAEHAETRLVKVGPSALAWSPDQGPIARDLHVDLSRYRTLSFWLHSEAATFGRIKISAGTDFSLAFAIDWTGWARFELPEWRFRSGAKDRPAAWQQAKGLRFEQTEPGFIPTQLVLDGLEQTTDWATIPINDNEVIIDWMYWGARTRHLWTKLSGEGGLKPFWSWGTFWVKERADQRDGCVYERRFDMVIDEYGTLEVRVANDNAGILSVHLQVDGTWTTPIAYHPGAGRFEEIEIPLPKGARVLNAVRLDLTEPADQIGGPDGRELKCNLHWLMLRRRGAPKGEPVVKAGTIAPIPLQGSLEENGIPGGIYFGKADLPRIRELFLRGPAKRLGAGVLKSADGLLGARPEDHIGRYNPGANWVMARVGKRTYGLAANARRCALAYVISGEKKYADHARRTLLSLCRIEEWTDGPFARFPRGWGGYGNPFCEASVTYAAALAYDWAYPAFTPEERQEVEQAILRKGVWWTYDKLKHSPSMLKMNQGVVFDSEIGCALLLLSALDPSLLPMQQQSAEWIWQGIEAYSLQDGASTEGVGYWNYTWNTAVKLLAALATRDPEGFRKRCPETVIRSMDWLAHMKSNGEERWVPVAVCDSRGAAPGPGVSALFAKYLGSETAAWFQQRSSGPPDEVAAFMWAHDTPATAPKLIPSRHFRGAGYVFLREGFEYGDVLFGLLATPRVAGHYQHDRGAFMLEAFGEYLAMDPGMISYANPIHRSLSDSRLHNTITIDGKDSTHTNVSVTRFFASPALDIVSTDLTKAYPGAKQIRRHAIYLRPDHVVVADEVELEKPGRIEWNLNSAGTLELTGNRLLAKAKRATLVTDFIEPAGLQLSTEEWPCGYPGLTNHHGTLALPKPSTKQRFLTSLYPVRPGREREVQVERLAKGDTLGVRILRGKQEDLVLWNPAGGIDAEDVICDGTFAVVRRVGRALRAVSMADGTRLVVDGQELLRAERKGTLAIDLGVGSSAVSALDTGLFSLPILPQAPKAILAGDVGGSFAPTPTLTADTARQGGAWFLLGDNEAALRALTLPETCTVAVVADGKTLPDGRVAGNAIPEGISLGFAPGPAGVMPDSLVVSLNGRRLSAQQFTVTEGDQGIAIAVATSNLLTPEERQPTFFTTHQLQAELRSAGLRRRPFRGMCQFSVRPKIAGNAVFLSDLGAKDQPRLASSFTHGGVIRDKAYSTDRITLGGVDFPKGLTTHPEPGGGKAYAELIYDLTTKPARLTRFRALVGMQTGRPGSVTFEVHTREAGGDWQQVQKTGEMGSSTKPVTVDVPLAGLTGLRLYVTDAGDGIGSDHAVWAMARFE
ncbi:MAG: hypothetical protein HN849_02080 [Victivallales bacterium]|nr:hypothetical protein [Victivallales bacterium]